MTDHPAGDPLTAYRRVLARARRAENTVRALRTENTRLRAAQAAPQRKERQQ